MGYKVQMTLADLSEKQARAIIVEFSGDNGLVERLCELGFVRGLEVTFVSKAPFGGPFIFRFGPTVLALRSEEARCALISLL